MHKSPEGYSSDLDAGSMSGIHWVYVLGDVRGVGGTERRMAEAAEVLVAAGGRVTAFVATRSVDSPLASLFSASGIVVRNTLSVFPLIRYLKSVPEAVTFTFGLRPTLILRGLRALRAIGGTSYSLRNGLDQGWSRALHTADRFTSHLQDGYLVNSDAVRNHLVKQGARPTSVHVVDGALGSEWLEAPLAPRKARSVVAMVGNSRPEKNQVFGLRVFEKVAAGQGQLRVYTDDASALRPHVSSALAPYVEFAEGVRLKPADYDDIDVLLMPSTSESVPRVLLEARARGCFVVTSDVGSSASVVDDRSSIVVSGFDLRVWSESLASALAGVERYPRELWRGPKTTRQYVNELNQLAASTSKRRRSHS